MDFRLLEYIVKIAEENNITKASEKLFISQSALNQQLLKLEQELGTRLCHRSRTNWHLTEAGKIYVEGARDALKIKHDTYTRIQDICDSKTGTLTIGLTHGRGIYMFASLYPELHSRYPGLDLRPVEMNVYKQQEAIVQGSIDMGFLALSREQRTSDCYENLISEEMVLALPASHPAAGSANPPGRPLAVINLDLLKDTPFVLLFKESSLHEIVPYFYSRKYPEGVVYFALPGHPCWDLAISYRKDIYLSSAARDFIELAKEYWENQKG